MPHCIVMELPGGGKAIVRMGGKKPPDCCWCKRMSTKLCDFVVSPPQQVTHKRTCDAPMCDRHATNVGLNIDYCPTNSGKEAA